MSVPISVGRFPVHGGLEEVVLPLHQHIQETSLAVLLFLGELDLGVLRIQVGVEFLESVGAMRPEDEGVVNISEPHGGRRGCGG